MLLQSHVAATPYPKLGGKSRNDESVPDKSVQLSVAASYTQNSEVNDPLGMVMVTTNPCVRLAKLIL